MAKKKKETKNETVAVRVLKAVAVIMGIIVILLALVFLGAQLYFGVPVIDYYRSSERAFTIPGLSDDMVPQGFDYLESEGLYLIGGYQKDGSASRVYRVDKATGKSQGYVALANSDGSSLAPHAGGLAAHGDYLYVAGDEDPFVYVFDLSEVLTGEDGSSVKTLGTFDTKCFGDGIRADFMCFTEDRFIVGEFYKDPNYPTPDSHVIVTSTGEENRALAYSYKLSDGEGSSFGIEMIPSEVYSLPGLVQGITVYEGKMWISQSYATQKSTICCYDVFGSEPVDHKTDIPVYALDGSTLVSSFEAPPMAEEIVIIDGKMYIMCESASNKYFFGNLTGGRWCYATDINKVLDKAGF